MLQTNPNGDFPKISRSTYVHETALVLGNVRIGKRAFIGPYAVIRADEPGPDGSVQPVVLADGVNVQDGAIIHSLGGSPVTIGKGTSISHGSLVHGPAEVGAHCFIGFKSVVCKSVLGDFIVVMHQALVENVSLPRRASVPAHACLTRQEDAAGLARVTPALAAFSRKVSTMNQWLAQANLGKPAPQTPARKPGRAVAKPVFKLAV